MLSWATKFLTLQRLFGEAEATRLVRASEDAIGQIASFTRQHAIDCDLRRDGVLYTATNAAQLGGSEGVIAELTRRRLNRYATLPVDDVVRMGVRVLLRTAKDFGSSSADF
jgi:glycine/D-amino acid oxidase-like deaminating enzyme